MDITEEVVEVRFYAGADTCAQQCQMPLRNPVSEGRFDL